MITMLLIALLQASTPSAPAFVRSIQFRQAMNVYGDCLDREAARLARAEASIAARYRRYSRACVSERADAIAIFVSDNSQGPYSRRDAYLQALDYVSSRSTRSASRILDPIPPMESAGPVHTVDGGTDAED